ncbi:hypothetical protein ACLMJK_002601 [Lecanora helva]
MALELSRKRSYVEAEALPEQRTAPYGLQKRAKVEEYVVQQPSAREMAPPPTPVDPNLESLNASPAPNIGIDQLLPTAPGPQQRPYYPKELNLAPNYFHEGQVSSMRPSHLDSIPSLNSHPDPWDSQRINGRVSQPQLMNHNYMIARDQPQQNGPQAYWDRSDAGSSNGRHVPDSGYYTQTHGTGSMYSGDLGSNHDCGSLSGRMTEAELPRDEMQFSAVYPAEPSMNCTDDYSGEQHQENSLDLVCETCQQKSKNKSEFTKHKLRHEKPFKCDVEGCNRVLEGFTTQNDLDRHKKSLHNVMTGKSYMCAVPHCAKKTKVWPRADNFRQHCQRLHKEWDLNELMDRSWERGSSRARHSEKEFGLIEVPPNDGRIISFDPTQSQLVNPQDINRLQNQELPAELYQAPNGTLYSVDGLHKPIENKTFSTQGRDNATGFIMDTSNRPGIVLDSCDAAPGTNAIVSPASYFTRPLSEAERVAFAKGQDHSFKISLSLPSHANRVPTKKDNASSSSSITREDVDAMFSAIADRFDGCKDKDELLLAIKTSALNLLGPNKSKKRSFTDSPSRDTASDTGKGKGFQCHHCPKAKKTQCELKKHEKRHTRPYGCTFSSCPRRFGSKDDWKRHENTMHWQIEAWKCAEPRDKPSAITDPAHAKIQNKTKHQCGQVFYRREHFQIHLDEAHKVKDPERVREQCKLRRVGRNGQRGFWCGFCQTVVSLKKRGLEAWDERFTHIDDEHFKKGERVDNWFPMDKELPKGILDEKKQDSDTEEEEGESGVEVADPMQRQDNVSVSFSKNPPKGSNVNDDNTGHASAK